MKKLIALVIKLIIALVIQILVNEILAVLKAIAEKYRRPRAVNPFF